MHGNYRLIKKDGRIGWNALEKQAVIELLDHNVNEPEGAVSVWFMSLEELCTTLRYDNFRMHNQFYDNYAIISDQREVCDHDNATFCINWNCGWYPQLSGKFFKGAIYPTGYAPVPKAIVTAGHCSFDKEEWYQLVFTWNKPENRYQIYINGILVAHSDTYTNGMEWEQAGERLYLGNPTFCISDIAFYQDGELLFPYKLSSGEKQMLVILLTVLVQDNAHCVLFMDEPEASLHIEWQQKLISMIRELNPNVQIILTTHSPAVIMEGWLDAVTEVSDIATSYK